MIPCSWRGCGSRQSRRFMGSALASLGSAADFKSRQSSPLPAPLACGSAPTVAAAAAGLACDHRTPLTPVATDRTTMPNP